MNMTLWAPWAKSVDLVTGEHRIALERSGGRTAGESDGRRPTARSGEAEPPSANGEASGCWQVDVDAALLRNGYRYSIDGGAPMPDPRSRWQPDGVHGESHVLRAVPGSGDSQAADGEAASGMPRFADSQAQPRAAASRREGLRGAVIYEMHVGTFTPEGTYAAAQAKLDHLVRLGITHVELMPLATFPGGRGWGYDGVDLYAPFPAYGTPQELAAFVQSCHARGLSVLLDVVYNHLGPDGNYLEQYGPYFTDRYKTAWGAALNYDGPYSDPVRRFVIDNALMWLRDYGFDGLRLDAVHAIFSFEAVHVLEELAAAVAALGEELGRTLVLIAESDLNDPRLVRPPERGGLGLHAHWADDFHHALHRFFTGEAGGYYGDFAGLRDVAAALRDGYVYQGQYSQHRRRRHGRRPAGVAAHQLVVFAQNHDQIGNRAQGERLSMLVGVAQLKAIAALTLLSPFVPLLFQGEEWGARTPFLYFTDHENAELGRLVTEGRRREFSSFAWAGEVPNPQEPGTFLRSILDWSELPRPQHADLYEWHRLLIRLRRGQGALEGRGRNKAAVKFDSQAGWLRFVYGNVLAAFNFAARPQRVPMPAGEWELALRSDAPGCSPTNGKQVRENMPPHSTHVYRRPAPPSID